MWPIAALTLTVANIMIEYTGELYARIGKKYCPTGKTGADWDALEAEKKRLKKAVSLAKQHIAADYGFEDWRIKQIEETQ